MLTQNKQPIKFCQQTLTQQPFLQFLQLSLTIKFTTQRTLISQSLLEVAGRQLFLMKNNILLQVMKFLQTEHKVEVSVMLPAQKTLDTTALFSMVKTTLKALTMHILKSPERTLQMTTTSHFHQH